MADSLTMSKNSCQEFEVAITSYVFWQMPLTPALVFVYIVVCGSSVVLAHSCLHDAVFSAGFINQTVNDGVAHSKNPRKCAYHVTFDLDLDLEHTLDAGSPGDHPVQVW